MDPHQRRRHEHRRQQAAPLERPQRATPDRPPLQPPEAPAGGQAESRYLGLTTPESAADDGQIYLAAYVRALIRRWPLVVVAFLSLAVPGLFLSRSGPDVYQARARIVIDEQTPEQSAIRTGANQPEGVEIQTHAAELRSRAVARRAIQELRLWENPAFQRDNRRSGWWNPRVLAGRIVSAARAAFTARHDGGAGAPAAANPADQPALVAAFLARLSIEPVPLSRLIDIKYRSSDPRFSADAANALAKAYVQQDLDSRFQSARTVASWLDEQLAEQRRRVSESLARAQQYREAQNVPSLGDRQQNVVSQKLADLNTAVTRAKTDRILREATYRQVEAVQSDPVALASLPVILSNGFIQQQKSQLAALQQERTKLADEYGEKHPEMVRVNAAIEEVEGRLRAETEQIVQSVRNEYEAALANERSLTAAYEQQRRLAIGVSRQSIDYAALEREAQSNQQVYDLLLQQAKQAGMAGEIRRSTIRITDPADVPMGPIGPQRTRNLLLAVLGAALFAVGLAFGVDLLTHEMASPEEVTRHLRVPFFGFVPLVVNGTDHARPMFNDHRHTGFSEAFRRIRTNVLLQAPPAGRGALMVTSTGPSEGKTLVAANLAVALAKAGQGVVVVDGDMREPKLNAAFGKKRSPGLANVLTGQCTAAEAMLETGTHGLLLMPAGSGPDNPAELLTSPAFAQLLDSLQESFQWVILDAPPVLPVTDATLIAHAVGNVLFVVGVDMTTRQAARTAVAQLENVQARILGAVLNKVNLARDSYYYSHYYGRGYEKYYGASGRATDPGEGAAPPAAKADHPAEPLSGEPSQGAADRR